MNEPKFRYIDRAEICHLRGIGKTKQFEDERAGRFPPGERLGMRCVRWRSDVVAAWLEAESERAQGASQEIAARQSVSARRGVEARRQRAAASSVLTAQG